MGSYKKIILLVFMILPLFTGSMAVVGLQTAYGTVVPFCGDGFVDPGEECDEDGANGTICGCNDSCQFPEFSTPCELDGNFCTADRCDGAGACVTVSAVICADGDGICEAGAECNPATGVCEDLADPEPSIPCEGDGDLCTLDHCDGLGSCVTLSTTTCQDGDDVCDGGESCNPLTGACEPLPDLPFSTPCEGDGDLCTIDHCDGAGACVTASTTTCQAGDGICEAGAECNTATGVCEELEDPPQSTPCELDGNLCTGDQCDGAGACVTVSAVTCQAGDGICEAGAECNPATGACEDLADPSSGTECSCSLGDGVCDENNKCFVEISIDIKPGSDPNPINVKKMGLVPVAILGSDTFDVSIVDYSKVKFGLSGATPIHMSLEDVNDDGFIDLVLLYVQKETGIAKGNVEACLSGETFDEQPFSGCDAIKTPGK